MRTFTAHYRQRVRLKIPRYNILAEKDIQFTIVFQQILITDMVIKIIQSPLENRK